MTVYADFVNKIEEGFEGVELLYVSLIMVVVLLWVFSGVRKMEVLG